MPDREKVITEIVERIEATLAVDSEYVTIPLDLLQYALALLKEQEAVESQDAEMLIIHNGGAEEYVKDIESIVLLAHKDYDIVYCGKFSEGR